MLKHKIWHVKHIKIIIMTEQIFMYMTWFLINKKRAFFDFTM